MVIEGYFAIIEMSLHNSYISYGKSQLCVAYFHEWSCILYNEAACPLESGVLL
jgi:hypothetical protein